MNTMLSLWPPVKTHQHHGVVEGLWPLPCRLLDVPLDLALAEGFAEGENVGRVLQTQLTPQAYRLTIHPTKLANLWSDRVTLEYGDSQGLRYGLRTLRQILAHGTVPALMIEDEPAIAQRAIMVDISRDRVPTMEEFFRLIDRAAELKANHLQLYVEHTFAYQRHSAVWEEASPLTAQELQQLDAKAQSRGIVLSVCQNMFGHMERWLKHPNYKHLGNFDNIAERLKTEVGPFSLNPEHPQSVSLPLELGAELRPLLSQGLLNFGGDETVDLGKGHSTEIVQARGLSTVYGQHLAKIATGLQAQGWRLQFWADIALEYPESLKLLPASLTALAWGYEADSDYDKWGKTLQSLGFDWWACPGTSAWRSLVGRRDARTGSIAAALKAAMRYGASGLMVTDWGDLGHRHTPPWAWLGWSEGLGCAWSGKPEVDWSALSRWTFPEWPTETASWMDQVSAYETKERQGKVHPLRGGSLINSSLVFVDSVVSWNHRGWLEDLALWQNLAQKIRSFQVPVEDEELSFPLEQLSWLVERAILRRQSFEILEAGHGANPPQEPSSPPPNSRQIQFNTSLKLWKQKGQSLIERHRTLWLKTSREGGLKDSVQQFTKLMQGAPEVQS